jgi:ribosome biogenesis GTPase
MSDVAAGVAEVFDDIVAITLECRFANCTHVDEPGCAIRGAIVEGTLERARFDRWRKLTDEDVLNSGNAELRRARSRRVGKRK